MIPTSYRSLFALATFGLAGLPASLSAQIAWDGTGDGINYTDGSNWVGDAAPANDTTTDIAQLTGGSVTLDADRSALGLDLDAASTLTGTETRLTLGASGLSGSADLTLGGSAILTTGAGTFAGNATIDGGTVEVTTGGSGFLGAGVITLDNDGTIAGQGENTNMEFTSLVLGANGGTLRNSDARAFFNVSDVSGSGLLTLDGGGSIAYASNSRIQLDGTTNTYTGGTLINNKANVQVSGPGSFGDISGKVTIDDARIVMTNSNNFDTREFEIASAGGRVSLNNRNVDLRGDISGTGDLLIDGQNRDDNSLTPGGSVNIYNAAKTISGNVTIDGPFEVRMHGSTTDMLGSGIITLDNGVTIRNRSNNSRHTLTNDIVIGTGGAGFQGGWSNGYVRSTGTVSGDGLLTIRDDGSSAIQFSGANTYTGGTVILGHANAKGTSALGTGTVTLNEQTTGRGVLQNWNGGSGGDAVTELPNDLIIDANGGRMKAGWDDKLEFTGVASGTGQLTIEADSGTVVLSNTANTFSGDIVLADHADSGNTTIGRIKVGSLEGGNYAGLISGVGSFEYTGIGTQTLTAANTYSGGTTISGGTLELTNIDSIGTGPVTLAAGGTLDIKGLVLANDFLNPSGGTLLNNDAPVDYSSNMFTSNGGTFTVDGSADVTLGELTRTAGNPTIIKEGSSTLTLLGATDNVSAFAEVNDGTLLLAKTSTGTVHAIGGFLTINGGTAELGGTGGDQIFIRSTVDLNGGIFDVNTRSEQIKFLNLHGGDITGSTGVLIVNSASGDGAIDAQSGTVAVSLAGDAALTKSTADTVTLSGAGNYTGDTTINEGTLVLGATTDLANGSTVRINGATSILQLDDSAFDLVEELWIDGAPMAAGEWGSTASGATNTDDTHFSGMGILNVNSMASNYDSWAAMNVGGQTPEEDFNLDGVQNGIAYFMNDTGQIALPGLVDGTITWTNGGNIAETEYGTQFVVQTSSDGMLTWDDVPDSDPNLSNLAGSVSYTPTAPAPFFIRLEVTPN
ncbi:beta strand repeat-containing protein [Haloferula sp.]|uniref:beta strand repeat-containing protein n=1 Tax=Haloferula sp. TaxID=2497595 RepID=UPI00329CC2FE